MKSYHFFSLRSVHCMAFAATTLLLSACINGYDEDWTFSSGVSGIALESPKAEEVTFTQNPEGTRVTIEWPVVMGAGGYEFIAYNVDDANNPVQLGEAQTIDGCSVDYDIAEDTSYKFCIRSLGNEEAGNQEAAAATEVLYSTLLATYAEIPNNTDLTAYFNENPIPTSGEELAYDLVPGGNYTMSGGIDFGGHKITLRGNKVNHPKVTFGEDASFATFAGLKIKFIDFDCNANTSGTFLGLSKTPHDSIKVASGEYVIKDPIAIQSCNIYDINKYLIYDNNSQKYGVENLSINDCYIRINQSDVLLLFKKSSTINFTLKESTLFSTKQSGKFFAQISGQRPSKITGYTNASFNINNCTLYNLAYNKDFVNWNNYRGQSIVTLNIQKSIIVDCGNIGNKDFTNKIMGNTNMVHNFRSNTYWWNGAVGADKNDTSTLQTEPFSYTGDGTFTVTGAEQLANRTGDPRWLPETSEGDTTE